MLKTIPGFTQISPLTAAAFCDLPYAPALLLDVSLSAKITDDRRFREACRWGFECYFDEMYEVDEQEQEVFVARSYTWTDVIGFVVENVLHWKLGDRVVELPSPAQDAGFVLGWLSAHALVDRPASLMALEVSRALIEPSSFSDEV